MEWMDEWINESLATSVRVNHWTVIYTCSEMANQFFPMKWHWVYQPFQGRYHVQQQQIMNSTLFKKIILLFLIMHI